MKENKVEFSYSFRQLCHMHCWYTKQMNIWELASFTIKSVTKEMEQLLLNVISVWICIRPLFCILQKLPVYLRLIFLFLDILYFLHLMLGKACAIKVKEGANLVKAKIPEVFRHVRDFVH